MQEKIETEASDGVRRLRTDHRTGKPVLLRDATFWKEHEQLRLQQGVSVPAYCAANGLALSTFRHRTSGRRRGAAKPAQSEASTGAKFVAVDLAAAASAAAPTVEIVAGALTMRLSGEAAERVLARVLQRLA